MYDTIWYKDVVAFLNINKLPEFIPFPSLSFVEKLNAIMRFSLYFAIVLLAVKHNTLALYIPLFVGVFTWGLYSFYEKEMNEYLSMHKMSNIHIDKCTDEKCLLPTRNNPFGNISIADYALNPNRPPGCKITKPWVKKMAEKKFEHNLYRDVDDVWGRRTSSRNFYQTPIQTIPNKQNEFAKWLYSRKRTCKEGNGDACLMNQM
jgi:hypothetical protein